MDELLFARAKQGDADAFAELISSHRRLIHNICWKYMGSLGLEDVEDAEIESMTRLWMGLNKYTYNLTFEGFVYRVTARVCLTMLRHNNAEKRGKYKTSSLDAIKLGENHDRNYDPEDTNQDVELQTIRSENNDELMRCLNDLPIDQHNAVFLIFFLNLPYAEVARMEGVPEGTIKSRVNRGLKRLRDLMNSAIKEPEERALYLSNFKK